MFLLMMHGIRQDRQKGEYGFIMKISSRRILASLIDYLIIGAFISIFSIVGLPNWFWSVSFQIGFIPASLPSLGVVVILLVLVLKDLLFKNASFGKRMMGLMIVDDEWRIPNLKAMLKRGFLMPVWGYIVFIIAVIRDNDFESWELKRLKTRVVEVKIYHELKHQCDLTTGEYKRHMDRLYDHMR